MPTIPKGVNILNETLNNIKSRRSCKKFLDKQITDEELNYILEAGMYAPSGLNKQSPIFIAIQDKEVIAQLSKINTEIWGKGDDGFYGATTVIVILSNEKILHTYQLDAMCCVQNMLIAAQSLGVGACCVSRAKQEFESEYGKNLLVKLGIDTDYTGIEHVVLGYRDGEKPDPLPRNENRIYRI